MKRLVLCAALLLLLSGCGGRAEGSAEESETERAAVEQSAPQSEPEPETEVEPSLSVLHGDTPLLSLEDFVFVDLPPEALRASEDTFWAFQTAQITTEVIPTQVEIYGYPEGESPLFDSHNTRYTLHSPAGTDEVQFLVENLIESDYRYTLTHGDEVLLSYQTDHSHGASYPFVCWLDDTTVFMDDQVYFGKASRFWLYDTVSGALRELPFPDEDMWGTQMLKADPEAGYLYIRFLLGEESHTTRARYQLYLYDLDTGGWHFLLDTFHDWWGESSYDSWRADDDTVYFYYCNTDIELDNRGALYHYRFSTGRSEAVLQTFWDTRTTGFTGRYALHGLNAWRTGGSTFGQYDMSLWRERYPDYDFDAPEQFALYDMADGSLLLREEGIALGVYEEYPLVLQDKALLLIDLPARQVYRLDATSPLEGVDEIDPGRWGGLYLSGTEWGARELLVINGIYYEITTEEVLP